MIQLLIFLTLLFQAAPAKTPTVESQRLQIKEGKPFRYLGLKWVQADGEIVSMSNWEANPKVKTGDYVLIYVDDAVRMGIQVPCDKSEVGPKCLCRTTLEEPHVTTCFRKEGVQ